MASLKKKLSSTTVHEYKSSYDILGYVFSYFICIWRQI